MRQTTSPEFCWGVCFLSGKMINPGFQQEIYFLIGQITNLASPHWGAYSLTQEGLCLQIPLRRASFTQQRISLSHQKLYQFCPCWTLVPHLEQTYPSCSNRMGRHSILEGTQTFLIDLFLGLHIPHQQCGGIKFAKFSLVY